MVLMQIRLAAMVLPVFIRPLRHDLAAWLLAGMCLAALGPFLLLAHPGYSQYYFVYGATPFGCVLWAWALSHLVGDSRERAVAASVTAGAVADAGLGIHVVEDEIRDGDLRRRAGAGFGQRRHSPSARRSAAARCRCNADAAASGSRRFNALTAPA